MRDISKHTLRENRIFYIYTHTEDAFTKLILVSCLWTFALSGLSFSVLESEAHCFTSSTHIHVRRCLYKVTMLLLLQHDKLFDKKKFHPYCVCVFQSSRVIMLSLVYIMHFSFFSLFLITRARTHKESESRAPRWTPIVLDNMRLHNNHPPGSFHCLLFVLRLKLSSLFVLRACWRKLCFLSYFHINAVLRLHDEYDGAGNLKYFLYYFNDVVYNFFNILYFSRFVSLINEMQMDKFCN